MSGLDSVNEEAIIQDYKFESRNQQSEVEEELDTARFSTHCINQGVAISAGSHTVAIICNSGQWLTSIILAFWYFWDQ